MTSWRDTTHFLFLLALLTCIELSEGDCHDYFKIDKWKKHFNNMDVVPLVKTKDGKNTIRCTLEKLNCDNLDLYDILSDCFEEPSQELSCPPECVMTEGELKVPLDNFMCLMAADIHHKATECEHYDSVCSYLSGELTSVSDQTPTSIPERKTTITAPIQERTTTTTAILPEIIPTLQSTTIKATENLGAANKGMLTNESTVVWRYCCLLSLLVNVVLLLVCISMCMQARRNTTYVFNTLTPDANGNKPESNTLLQPLDGDSTIKVPLNTLIQNGGPH